MSNATFSTAINQANNKNTSQINAKNDSIDDKQKTKETAKSESSSKVDTIKDAIKNGTYKLDLRGSAEKLAQELLR